MKHTIITLLLIIGCSMRMLSQERTDFLDDFSENTNSWLVEKTNEHEFSIHSGQYDLNKTEGEGSYMVWKTIPTVDSRDWTIEARMKLVSGSEQSGFGLLFNTANADSSYLFVISAEGFARVYNWSGSELTNIVAWRKSPSIKAKGEWNVLSIQHRMDYTAFYVNSVCIGSMTSSDYTVFGNKIGFVVENVMNVVVDKLSLKSNAPSRSVEAVSTNGTSTERVNLGANVNSTSTELSAISSADGKSLYFVRRRHPQNLGTDLRDDIWLSTKDQNNTWSVAQNVGAPLNNVGYNSVISVTPDNNTLLLQNTYATDGSPNGAGISISHRNSVGWEIPKAIALDSGYNLNEYEEFALSPDAKVLVASIEQYNTKGSKDLYVFFRTSDTSFTRPLHIDELATPGSEMAPFIASDGLTMYYSTNGLPGYGGQDIFVTTRLDSTWMHWSKPKNLGQGINTDSFDAYFRTTAKGDSAYLITYANSLGGGDIVRIAVPPEAQPKKVGLISGHVFDAKSKRPLGAGVVYEFLATNKEAGIARSNPQDGSYSIVLPTGNLYGFRAEAPGYYSISEQLDTRGLTNYEELKRDLFLVPIEKDAKIRLNNLFFDFAKSDLRPESSSELDRLIDFLKNQPAVHISIEGHTDNVGDEKSNLTLSQQRAASVLKYLKQHGVVQTRMNSRGFGKSKPVDDNATEEGRQKNRRVEFVITEK